jgi:hypothetical protein
MRSVGKVGLVLLFIGAMGIFFSQLATAAVLVYTPEDHSVYIDQRDPDENKSYKSGILTASAISENARIVIHFDFGGWTPDPPTIVQAKLHLYHYRGGNYTGYRTLNCYPLTTGFDETTATWNSPWTLPGGDFDPSYFSSADVPEAWENWVEWDVTDILKNRWSNVTDFGFMIKDPEEDTPVDGPYVRFRSHRYAGEYPQEIPYLEITTTAQAIPTLTEWGIIIFGVMLVGFMTWVFLRRRQAVVSVG